jgi:hypothetical protein
MVREWYTSAAAGDKRNFVRSLVPTSLVDHLRKKGVHPKEIQTLVNTRDRRWTNALKHARSVYTAAQYTVSDQNGVDDSSNPSDDSWVSEDE